MKLGDRLCHKRLPDWEPFDAVTIATEPRLKTSGMSGDEWRIGYTTTLWFKGHAIVERFYNRHDFALAHLPVLIEENSCPIAQQVIDIERECCDQPSCGERAVSKYKLKRLFSDRGELLDPSDGGAFEYYRQFCARHLYRGDCSREDCDKNYEVIIGPGPHESQERPEDESPSACVVVHVDAEEGA